MINYICSTIAIYYILSLKLTVISNEDLGRRHIEKEQKKMTCAPLTSRPNLITDPKFLCRL